MAKLKGKPTGHKSKTCHYLRVAIRVEDHKPRLYCLHRLAWLYVYGEFPERHLDHINGVKTDNRIVNLRLATKAQNEIAKPVYKDTISGYKGVTKMKQYGNYVRKKPWYAHIMVNGKCMSLGYYFTAEEAAKARNEASVKYFGEYAWLNPIPESSLDNPKDPSNNPT